jgi:hypothetical protein
VGAGKEEWARHVLMMALCAVVFCAYCHTLCTGIYPGSSAVVTGQVLGLVSGVRVSHPVWFAISRAVAMLPVIDLPFRMNVLSAVCGCLAVAWAFRMARRVLFEIIRPVPAPRTIPVCEVDSGAGEALAGGTETSGSGDRERKAGAGLVANLGGVVCALVFAFSAPFWLASTSLHAQSFDTLLVVIAADLTAAYFFTGQRGSGVAAVFFCGLLCAESPSFLLPVSVMALVAARACVRYDHRSGPFLLLLSGAALAGGVAGLTFYWLGTGAGAGINLTATVRCFMQAYGGELADLLGKTPWLFTLVLPLLMLLLAGAGLRVATLSRNEATRRTWCLIGALNTAFTMAGMFALPYTVWAV